MTTGFTIDSPKAQCMRSQCHGINHGLSHDVIARWSRYCATLCHCDTRQTGAPGRIGINRAVGSSHPLNMRPDRGGARPRRPDGPLDHCRKRLWRSMRSFASHTTGPHTWPFVQLCRVRAGSAGAPVPVGHCSTPATAEHPNTGSSTVRNSLEGLVHRPNAYVCSSFTWAASIAIAQGSRGHFPEITSDCCKSRGAKECRGADR